MRDGLRRVDDAAAADGEKEVRLEVHRFAHGLTRKRKARIRPHAAPDGEGKARRRDDAFDAREQPALDDTAAAVNDKGAMCAVLSKKLRRVLLDAAAKYDLCRTMKRKLLHVRTSPSSMLQNSCAVQASEIKAARL